MKNQLEIKPDLRDLSALDLQSLVVEQGEKPFRARQVLRWLYKHAAPDIESMTNLSKGLRRRLARAASLRWMKPAKVEVAADGTRKLLFELEDGQRIESVLIPEKDHHTLCISTQAGCRQGCRFCATGDMGFKRNLSPREITGQILTARSMVGEELPLTNLVFMGMGEPLDNLENLLVSLEHILGDHGLQMSQRKVTVSTAGLVPQLAELGRAAPVALAVSLNAPNDELRSRIMPVNRRWPLAELKRALMAYPLKPSRRITLEYVLLGGVNDQPLHALELIRWTQGLRCKVNLIVFNPHPGSPYQAPRPGDVDHFQQILIEQHMTAMLRASRGSDISAACGQLAAGVSIPV